MTIYNRAWMHGIGTPGLQAILMLKIQLVIHISDQNEPGNLTES